MIRYYICSKFASDLNINVIIAKAKKILFIILFFTFSCGSSSYSGSYCANVSYFNPHTNTHSEYELIVDVFDDTLEKISFPRGWIDKDEFGIVKLNNTGYTSFYTNKGYKYSVQVKDKAENCFEDVAKVRRCKGITKGGTRCRKLTDNKSGYCSQHKNQSL